MQCAGRPFLSFVSVQKSRHSYTSHWNHWKLFQNIPIKLAPLCPPPLLLSQLAFGGPSYLSFLNIGFQPKQPKQHGLLQAILSSHRGFNVSILDVGRPPRGGGSVWSLYMSNTGKTQQLWYNRFFCYHFTTKWWNNDVIPLMFQSTVSWNHFKTKWQNHDMIMCYNMMIW